MGADLEDGLRGFVGTRAGGLRLGRDPVNLPMIHHWVQAAGDRNPVYVDEELARSTRHRGLVAPPALLQTWTMDAAGRDAPVHTNRDDEPGNPALALLDAAGYTAVVATDYTHEYARELRLGDRIGRTALIEQVSAEKRTALGSGFFVTMRYDYVDAAGEPVGIGRMRLLKYRPEPRPGPVATDPPGADVRTAAAARPRPVITRDNAHFWAGTRGGELLIQRCASCGVLRHPPSPMCGSCRGTEWDTVAATGTGTVHSFVVHHHPPLPGFPAPHVPVLVELAEGVRVVSHLTGSFDPADVRIGMPVSLVFSQVDDELTLPLFELADAAGPAGEQAAEAVPGDLVFDKVAAGDELPPLRIETTASRIVACAIASRDYEAVHHDRDEARRRGTKDIFLNILTSNGFALRYVTDWAGPEAIVTAAAIRLGVPSYAGDTLRLTGRVESAEPGPAGSGGSDPGAGRVVVAVQGRNSLGVHLHGTVTITLPREPA